MKGKVIIVFFIFFIYVHCAKVNSRQNDLKKDSIRIAKTFRSRGEAMENLFIIFDPSFLSYVWPKIKNGVHINIGHNCWDDVSVFLKDLSEGHAWAYREDVEVHAVPVHPYVYDKLNSGPCCGIIPANALKDWAGCRIQRKANASKRAADASGRYHSGLFEGKRFWLGSKEQCLLLDETYMSKKINETWGEFYSGDYLDALFSRQREFGGNIEEWDSLLRRDALMRRVVSADNQAPLSLAYTVLQLTLNITKFTMPKSYDLTLGLCLPRSCAAEDIVSIVHFSIMINDNLRTNRTVSRSIKLTSLRHVENSFDIRNDVASVSLILITLTLVLISIIATIVDLDLIKFKRYSKSISFDLEQYTEKSDKSIKPIEPAHTTLDDALQYNDIKKVSSKKTQPPVITLDVRPVETKSCIRCGKYKKQCENPINMDIPCPRAKFNSCSSLTTEFKKKNGVYKNLLLSFSLKHSWMRIFNTTMANKDLAFVHILKMVAILWIIFVHVTVVAGYLSEKCGNVNECNTVYYIVSTGTLAFDTLFFVSGLLSAQHFFYLKSHYSVEELVTIGGALGQALQLICFIVNRAVRQLPPYAYALLAAGAAARAARDAAPLRLPERGADACARLWWRDLLYVSDLYPAGEQCLQMSWCLSVETKLHMAGALLCLLLAAGRRALPALAGAGAVAAASALDLWGAYGDYSTPAADTFALYAARVARGAARAAPYGAGVAAGWLLHARRGRCALSRLSTWCLWSASGLLLALSLSLQRAGWLAAAAHLTWPLALLWPVVACSTTYSTAFTCTAGAPRLAYGAALLHGPALRLLLLAAGAPPCARLACLWCYWAGAVLATFIAALLLALLVEMPACCLLRRLSDCARR